jgi:hypothetical protein
MDMFSLKLRKPEPPLFTTVGFFSVPGPVQPRSTAAEPSPATIVVSLLPKASPEIVIQAPPSAPLAGEFAVPGRSTRYGISCYGIWNPRQWWTCR